VASTGEGSQGGGEAAGEAARGIRGSGWRREAGDWMGERRRGRKSGRRWNSALPNTARAEMELRPPGHGQGGDGTPPSRTPSGRRWNSALPDTVRAEVELRPPGHGQGRGGTPPSRTRPRLNRPQHRGLWFWRASAFRPTGHPIIEGFPQVWPYRSGWPRRGLRRARLGHRLQPTGGY